MRRWRLDGDSRPVPGESLAELVCRWARRTPDATAIAAGESTVTFGELHRRARLVADRLTERGVGPGDHVALWAERTPNVLCAALGIWLARAAYVPIDPSFPHGRVRTILDLASPAMLAYDGEAPGRGPPGVGGSFDIAAALEVTGERSEDDPDASWPEAADAAYVIFTSGSTGVPKGVVVEHRSLVNYAAWCGSVVAGSGAGSPLFGSLGFDLAVTSWWVPLSHGKPVTLVAGIWEQEALFDARDEPYSFIKLTPSHARLFERLSRPDYGAITERLMFGGEALRPELVAQLEERSNGVRLINHYGPTEATVGCCWNEFDGPSTAGLPSVPIGRPVWNSRAYVVDGELRGVRAGDPGELVIAGAPVARGYLHDGDDGRFLDESELEGGRSGGRAYRTGDVVELRPDGTLLFLGRDDDQLNVGGHRVEREELRRQAMSVPGVAEAAFEVVGDTVEVVAATVVASDPAIGRAELSRAVRRALAEVMPAAVTPKSVHVVDRLALDSNGKLDLLEASRA